MNSKSEKIFINGLELGGFPDDLMEFDIAPKYYLKKKHGSEKIIMRSGDNIRSDTFFKSEWESIVKQIEEQSKINLFDDYELVEVEEENDK